MPRLPRLAHKALVRQANWKGLCLITGKQAYCSYRPFPHYGCSEQTKINEDEAQADNFIQITVFCPPEPRVGAFVYRNAGKVYWLRSLIALSQVPFLSSVQLGTVNPLLNPLSQIFPPSLTSPPFQGKKVDKPPLPSSLLFFTNIW